MDSANESTVVEHEQRLTEWRVHRGPYLGDISALCFLHIPNYSLPFLLAGLGSEILVYNLELGKFMRSFSIFEGVRVHGITSSSLQETTASATDVIAVFGETRVKLCSFSFDNVSCSPQLTLIHLLPKLGHWVLDICFIKGCLSHSNLESHFLAIGCSDNSVHIWDISNSNMVLKVQSPVRCLLYSMRLWGHNLEVLRIASGTIFNEIVVWKVAPQHDKSSSTQEDHEHQSVSSSNYSLLKDKLYEAVHVCKLIGHEGSIFRIAWSDCGSKLLSVSDDRSARLWAIPIERGDLLHHDPIALVLFGHNARVWDCCISDYFIVTVSEDCTCRIWGVDGEQLQVIKEHIGRGIWRCLYDPNSSLLITAGFDSAIKVHKPHAFLTRGLAAAQGSPGRTEMFSICIPNVLEHIGFMDSKSEYVRCLRFSCQDSLYVATNHGYLYHAKLRDAGGAQWNQLVQVSNGAPIICMDLLSKGSFELDSGAEDWIAIGDGKGNMTVIGVTNNDCTPTVRLSFTWPAEMERQLLGTYWCKSLGCRYVFTADPRGRLKLWRLPDPSQSNLQSSTRSNGVSHVAEFISSYGMRIMCLDACLEEEVLACGDLRGNMVLFPLLKSLVLGTSVTQEMKIPPVNHFKGVHGISSVSSVFVTKLDYNQIEICSTGADGCICYLEYDREMQNLQFTGMKQVKELSLIEYVSVDNSSRDILSSSYAVGFASVDFIVWNLVNENKVVKIPCGGWRRPHSYYLGDVPEMKNCFAFVKDEMIHIHRHWIHDRDGKIYPQSLHMQFHGREIHSLCFISEEILLGDNHKRALFSKSSWIATGCEDGTVRLTWYSPGTENWSMSKLLGEHVGGSAVRSICCVSKLHTISSDTSDVPDGRSKLNAAAEDKDNPILLISVGAKRVLTSWLLKNRRLDNKNNFLTDHQYNSKEVDDQVLSSLSSSMTFQWLSTDMPAKYSITHKYPENNVEKVVGVAENVSNTKIDAGPRSLFSERGMMDVRDKHEDDWRYLAVTAFLVKCAGSRISVCFVVVSCSDATLMLRALILPFRLWFDVALLVPLLAPVLSLQHIIFPICRPYKENIKVGNVYIVISGSTDGSVTFWDLTDSVEAFMQRVSDCDVEKFFDCQKRPRTGRGSQGGRWWRSLSSGMSKKRQDSGPLKAKGETKSISYGTQGTSSVPNDSEDSKMVCSQAMHTAPPELETKTDNLSVEICEIQPLHLLQNIHQSGVNCLHVSEIKGGQNTDSCHVYSIISGGDDQALHHLIVELSPKSINLHNGILTPDIPHLVSEPKYGEDINFQNRSKNYEIRFLNYEKFPSAHSSSVKGVWTDGSWVFSTGLDQRVRCWHLHQSKLIERAHLIVSVPEPEALSARACGRNHYQIAVAGRGMQIVDFSGS
ncbi:WD40/YVTN repeat-like-containing domain superfamily [Sesbania bispinosa]|nr:WD40/YVTN repeat-like-containing domain superfamily [Sesbania bispinosa]